MDCGIQQSIRMQSITVRFLFLLITSHVSRLYFCLAFYRTRFPTPPSAPSRKSPDVLGFGRERNWKISRLEVSISGTWCSARKHELRHATHDRETVRRMLTERNQCMPHITGRAEEGKKKGMSPFPADPRSYIWRRNAIRRQIMSLFVNKVNGFLFNTIVSHAWSDLRAPCSFGLFAVIHVAFDV